MKLHISVVLLVMVVVASANPVPPGDESQDSKPDFSLNSVETMLALTKGLTPKNMKLLLQLMKGENMEVVLQLLRGKNMGLPLKLLKESGAFGSLKSLMSLANGMTTKDMMKMIGSKSLGQLVGPTHRRKLHKLLDRVGPVETAFAVAAGFTTMAGIHQAAAHRESAERPNSEEWETVYSVWMDMLQKDLDESWLSSKHKNHL